MNPTCTYPHLFHKNMSLLTLTSHLFFLKTGQQIIYLSTKSKAEAIAKSCACIVKYGSTEECLVIIKENKNMV